MRLCRMRPNGFAVVTSLAMMAATATAVPLVAEAAQRRGAPGPQVRLVIAQKSLTVEKFKHQPVPLDPGIWVAAAGSDLRFNVQRANYAKPLTITQLIQTPWGTTQKRRLPASVLDGWNGLKNFLRLTVTDTHGKMISSQDVSFCPDSPGAQRVTPVSPRTSPYPQQCITFGFDPFLRGAVWGLTRGWAVDPFAASFPFGTPTLQLPLGKYQATVAITAPYTKLLHIPADAAKATVNVTVIAAKNTCGPLGCASRSGREQVRASQQRPPLQLPALTRPPRAALPQLTALPSWGITTSHTSAGQDLLDFGATVWVGGNSPLDVEGFRIAGSPIMRAYQYFWRDGQVIGRVRVGTMGFDNKKGHQHWHFQQFARYRLLTTARKLAVPSQKVGFCIAPTDPVDMLLPHAVWRPTSVGLGGACGVPSALWVQEYLPIGWGDTYFQSAAGQSFDITNVPNGRYYIQITANPMHQLHELSVTGNTSQRKVILGGTKGHRTVRVPAWHGIDPEH